MEYYPHWFSQVFDINVINCSRYDPTVDSLIHRPVRQVRWCEEEVTFLIYGIVDT